MYKEIDSKDLKLNNNNLLLLVTATSLETLHLHNELKPFDTNDSILKINYGNYTYYIGEFGNYLAVHVQCGTMGSISRDSSITTISDAISLFNPKITLMIGIAFGVDHTDQNIGDVLVSECITPYNFKKIQNGRDTIRTNDAPSSKLLINKFKNVLGWEFLLKDGLKAKNIIAPILSGEELINDIKRRNELVKEKPTAKGGEMEGVGLSTAADGKCEWILVKGICDFADGNKDKDKDANQVLAMRSAVSLCKEVFSSKTAFESIDLNPIKTLQNEIYKIKIKHEEQFQISEIEGARKARQIWLNKKTFLEQRLPIISDMNQQFTINSQITEANEKINFYNNQISNSLTQISK
jgi:nucleoside phosphorylase